MKIDPSGFVIRTPFTVSDLTLNTSDAAVMPAASTPPRNGDFLKVFENAVLDVDARTRAASDRMHAVDAGQSDDLVGAMLASQEAGLSFSMLMQVRNKVMGAVEEIVKLQV